MYKICLISVKTQDVCTGINFTSNIFSVQNYFKIIYFSRTMRSCVVCGSHQNLHTFPKEHRLLEKWLTHLSLRKRPSPSDKICINHFLPSDIMQTAKGYKKIRPGAVPFSNIKISDHNYSAGHKDSQAETLSQLMFLTPIFVCWLPLLLLFCYTLGGQDPHINIGMVIVCL